VSVAEFALKMVQIARQKFPKRGCVAIGLQTHLGVAHSEAFQVVHNIRGQASGRAVR